MQNGRDALVASSTKIRPRLGSFAAQPKLHYLCLTPTHEAAYDSRAEVMKTHPAVALTLIRYESALRPSPCFDVQLMRHAKPLWEPKTFRGATNKRRFYEEITMPRNLVSSFSAGTTLA